MRMAWFLNHCHCDDCDSSSNLMVSLSNHEVAGDWLGALVLRQAQDEGLGAFSTAEGSVWPGF